MSKSSERYYEKIEDYLSRDFFKKDDRKISFLLGRYYSSMAYKEKNDLKTTSLYTKLPVFTKRLDKEQVFKIADKCNSVAKRLISKRKDTSGTDVKIWEKMNELISKDKWESSHYELSLAFMMGFTFYVDSEKEQQEELEE